MERVDIFEAISAERARQDEKWGSKDKHKHFAHHILVLESKVARIRGMWYDSTDANLNQTLRNELVKVAAIAVRALENVPEVK